jgi:hypothetical protein
MSQEEVNQVLVANGYPPQKKKVFNISTAVDNINAAYNAAVTYQDVRLIIVAHAKRYGNESACAWLMASVSCGFKYLITLEHLYMIVKELKKQGKL